MAVNSETTHSETTHTETTTQPRALEKVSTALVDSASLETAVRALLMSDLVGSTRLVEVLGDWRAAEVFERHDRLARDLLAEYQGLEIDKSDGFLLLFDRPVQAVNFALRYHAALRKLSQDLGSELVARVGIHFGEVILHRNLPKDVGRGAKAIEVDGLAKPMVARMEALARGGQTLMTRSAFDLARRASVDSSRKPERLSWLSHGKYVFKGIREPIEVYEVGARDVAPLSPPADSEKAWRAVNPLSRLRRAVAVSFGVIVLLAAGAVWRQGVTSREQDAVTAAEPRQTEGVELVARRVIVIPFENRTGDPSFNPLGMIIADWLTQGLSRVKGLEIVPTELAVRATQFVSRQGGDGAGISAVCEETGSGAAVSGAYYRQGDELVLRGQFTDVVAGKVVAGTQSLRASVDNPISLLEELEETVRAEVAFHLDPKLAPMTALVNPPPSYEAYEAYVVGMERFVQLDFAGSLESLKVAAETDPTFATPQVLAAAAHLNMGQFAEVDAIVGRLSNLRESLAPLDRYHIDWLAAECRGNRSKALRAAHEAVQLAPHSQWAENLGVESLRANLPAQAVDVLAPLDPERGFLRGWAPHFHYLTMARHLLGDHDKELADARYGHRLYPNLITGFFGLLRALAIQGSEGELFELFEQVKLLPNEFVYTPGTAISLAALELAAHGRPELARRAAEMAIDWYRQRPPSEAAEPLFRESLAEVLFFAQRFEEARSLFEELNREFPGTVDYLGYLGVLAVIRGDFTAARRRVEELRELDQPYLFGKDDYWRAVIHAWRGEKQLATRQFRQALSKGYPFEWPELHPHIDPLWSPLRDYVPFLEIIEPKG